MYKNIDFANTNAKCIVNVTSGVTATDMMKIEIRLGAANGPLVGEIPITNTGGWCQYKQFSGHMTVSGIQDVYLVFVGGKDIFDLDWVKFESTTPSAVRNNTLQNVAIYPNPAQNVVNIQIDDNHTNATLQVFTLLGEKIYSQKLISPVTTIDTNELGKKTMLLFRISSNNNVRNNFV